MIELYPTSSYKLQVYDVSALLYTYTCITQGKKNVKASIVKGINVSGVKAVMEMIAKAKQNNIRVVLCLDSYCDKKRESKEYKANRVYHPEIHVQSEIIDTYFRDFGVDVIRVPGYEADDLIYSVVESNLDKFNDIEVIAGDADIYGCMISPKVHILGANSTRPSFDISEYSTCVKAGEVIKYNCIIPYMTFFGKASNNLNKLPLDKMNSYYLEEFEKMLEKDNALPFGSRLEYMINFLNSNVVKQEHIELIAHRASLTYPKLLDKQIERKGPKPDAEKLTQFLSYFRFTNTAGIYGVMRYLDAVSVNPSMNSLMKRLYATVTTGTMMADKGLNQQSFVTPIINVSEEFTEVGNAW